MRLYYLVLSAVVDLVSAVFKSRLSNIRPVRYEC